MADLLLALPQQWIIASSWGGKYHALDSSSGETVHAWDAGISPQCGASADAQGNLYLLRSTRGEGVQLVRANPAGHETVIHRQPEGKRDPRRAIVAASSVLDEVRRVVYWVANQDREAVLLACSMDDNHLRWQRSLPKAVVGTPALGSNGSVWVAALDGFVHIFHADGLPLARYATETDYLLAGPVTDSNGNAWLGDPLGQLHHMDSKGNGRVVYEALRSVQARPAFDPDGNLYFAATDRSVLIFRNRT
jgi:hypothetical protein